MVVVFSVIAVFAVMEAVTVMLLAVVPVVRVVIGSWWSGRGDCNGRGRVSRCGRGR